MTHAKPVKKSRSIPFNARIPEWTNGAVCKTVIRGFESLSSLMNQKVYNTISRRVEDFTPIEEGKVKVYICGLTVYDDMHIGHARTYMSFDTILRYLKYKGLDVKYIQNITDIDDKIINRARERDMHPLELSKKYSERMRIDQKKLGLMAADEYPRVSENIPEIIVACQKLIASGNAYEVGGDIYFDVSSFSEYGRLSNQDIEKLGRHRIEENQKKKSPLDFAIWKGCDDEYGFESPWGLGRPGWHIECSVMSQKYLGPQIDIHGGALDLIFPHHENEVAQSESLSGKKPFVKYWMHTGFLNSSGEKMSKSLGNITAVNEFLKTYEAQAVRLFMIQTHYRSPIDYSEQNMQNAVAALKRLRNFVSEIETRIKDDDGSGVEVEKIMGDAKNGFIESMEDDFKTPQALGHLFEAVRSINQIIGEKPQDKSSLTRALNIFLELTKAIGFELKPKENELDDEIIKKITLRNEFRAMKKWVESDKIRDELAAKGIILKDRKDGSTGYERI